MVYFLIIEIIADQLTPMKTEIISRKASFELSASIIPGTTMLAISKPPKLSNKNLDLNLLFLILSCR